MPTIAAGHRTPYKDLPNHLDQLVRVKTFTGHVALSCKSLFLLYFRSGSYPHNGKKHKKQARKKGKQSNNQLNEKFKSISLLNVFKSSVSWT